ncbi:MAG: hypothetical protein MPI95_01225 [Nitrosopumilus sp.]|nr:hypothetical protein [Nitrosopumilus sp.]CAI9832160.1 putative nitrogen regulatory protein P-II [Nitrosopumilaceae archaeon]MDA7941344.1 hypothetical protein [Nitrosopumilus sp.]MDA7942755.1 hypothetical protein [Nitrosopumilus sp.]MDA7945361.1 hypothetical protein [Nitrosopumilus sp.]
MKLYPVKLLTVTCEILARDAVISILEGRGVTGYTTYEVAGKGDRGVRGSGLEGEKNAKVEAVVREEVLTGLVEEISQKLFADYALVLYVADVGVARVEKF